MTITDRGRPVAGMTPIPSSRLRALIDAGHARPAKRPLSSLPTPGPGLSLRCVAGAARRWMFLMAVYLDTSALVKLVVAEPESTALRSWLTTDDREAVSCDLARTELMRAVRRGAPDRLVAARAVLDALTLVEVTTAVFETAGRLEPTEPRSLDALHVAAALDLGDDLDDFVAYDDRLLAAASANGISVVSRADGRFERNWLASRDVV